MIIHKFTYCHANRHKSQQGKGLIKENVPQPLLHSLDWSLHVIDFNKTSRQDILKLEKRKHCDRETNMLNRQIRGHRDKDRQRRDKVDKALEHRNIP